MKVLLTKVDIDKPIAKGYKKKKVKEVTQKWKCVMMGH